MMLSLASINIIFLRIDELYGSWTRIVNSIKYIHVMYFEIMLTECMLLCTCKKIKFDKNETRQKTLYRLMYKYNVIFFVLNL